MIRSLLAALVVPILSIAPAGVGAQSEAPSLARWIDGSGVILRSEPSASASAEPHRDEVTR